MRSGPAPASLSVLLTRPARDDDPFAAALEARGLRVLAVPTVATAPAAPGGPLDAAVARLGAYAWVVLTSAIGVDALAEAARRAGLALPLPVCPPRWAAVGPATARAIERLGVQVDVVAGPGAAALPGALAANGALRGARILLPRADAADDELPARLRDGGALVEAVVAYHTIEAPAGSTGPLARALDDPTLGAVVVASGSAVRGLVALATACGRRARLDRVPVVSIGPSTSSVARSLGVPVAAEAMRPTPAAVADAVAGVAHAAPIPTPRPLEAPR